MKGDPFPPSDQVVVEYQARAYHSFWAIAIPVTVVAVVVGIGITLVTTIGFIGPFFPFLLLPVTVAVMLSASWGTEAYWLALTADGQLLWKTTRRKGQIPLRNVRSIHSSYPPWLNIVTIEAVDQDKVTRVPVLRGFGEFVAALRSRNPEIHVRFDWGARLAERGPWRARVRRVDGG